MLRRHEYWWHGLGLYGCGRQHIARPGYDGLVRGAGPCIGIRACLASVIEAVLAALLAFYEELVRKSTGTDGVALFRAMATVFEHYIALRLLTSALS